MRKQKKLGTFRVYFAAPTACVKINAASKEEARTIAQDNYSRGEITTGNAGRRLLPEGREIEAELYAPDRDRQFIMSIIEEGP